MDFSTVKGNPSAEEGVNMSIRSSFRRQCSTDLMGYEKEKFAENQKAREGFQDENDERIGDYVKQDNVTDTTYGEKKDSHYSIVRVYIW